MCIHVCVCTHISEDRRIQNKQKLQWRVLFIQFSPGLILEAFLQFLRKATIMWYCWNIEGTYFPQWPFFNTQFKYYSWNLISFPFCHPGWSFLEQTRWAMRVRPGMGFYSSGGQPPWNVHHTSRMPLYSPLRWNSFLKAGCFSPKHIGRLPWVKGIFSLMAGWHPSNVFPSVSYHRGFQRSWLLLTANGPIIDMCGRISEPNKTLFFSLHFRPITIIALSRCLPSY